MTRGPLSKLLLALSFAGGVTVAAGGWLALAQREPPQRSSAELMDVVMWNREPVGGPFALVDHDGKPRTDADFRGRLMLIYFGFTFCPDICPTDLQVIAGAIDQLGPHGESCNRFSLTLDPERDTPEHLAQYVVGLFHPRLIGLTGDAESKSASRGCSTRFITLGFRMALTGPSITPHSFI